MPGRESAQRSIDFALILLLGLLWGSPYALTKISLETIPPITMVAARVTLAAATLWLVVMVRGYRPPRESWLAGRFLVQGLISCVVPYTLIAIGQRSVESGLAAILNSTVPLFVCLIGVVWTRHEPTTSSRMLGVAVGFAGVVLIVGANALLGLGQHALGQIAIIVATISSAIGVIHGRRFDAVTPEFVAAGMLTSSAVVLLPLCFVLETPWQIEPSAASLVALLINAVVATAVGFVVYFRLIRTIGSMAAASVSYLKPAVGLLIGCLWFGEPFSAAMVLGLAAILLGVWIINRKTGALDTAEATQSTPP
jgi:drug/metabolite transporter (DMT)-like permease